jgi:hypothetical protein
VHLFQIVQDWGSLATSRVVFIDPAPVVLLGYPLGFPRFLRIESPRIVVDRPVENAVGQRRMADLLVPARGRQL